MFAVHLELDRDGLSDKVTDPLANILDQHHACRNLTL